MERKRGLRLLVGRAVARGALHALAIGCALTVFVFASPGEVVGNPVSAIGLIATLWLMLTSAALVELCMAKRRPSLRRDLGGAGLAGAVASVVLVVGWLHAVYACAFIDSGSIAQALEAVSRLLANTLGEHGRELIPTLAATIVGAFVLPTFSRLRGYPLILQVAIVVGGSSLLSLPLYFSGDGDRMMMALAVGLVTGFTPVATWLGDRLARLALARSVAANGEPRAASSRLRLPIVFAFLALTLVAALSLGLLWQTTSHARDLESEKGELQDESNLLERRIEPYQQHISTLERILLEPDLVLRKLEPTHEAKGGCASIAFSPRRGLAIMSSGLPARMTDKRYRLWVRTGSSTKPSPWGTYYALSGVDLRRLAADATFTITLEGPGPKPDRTVLFTDACGAPEEWPDVVEAAKARATSAGGGHMPR